MKEAHVWLSAGGKGKRQTKHGFCSSQWGKKGSAQPMCGKSQHSGSAKWGRWQTALRLSALPCSTLEPGQTREEGQPGLGVPLKCMLVLERCPDPFELLSHSCVPLRMQKSGRKKMLLCFWGDLFLFFIFFLILRGIQLLLLKYTSRLSKEVSNLDACEYLVLASPWMR